MANQLTKPATALLVAGIILSLNAIFSVFMVFGSHSPTHYGGRDEQMLIEAFLKLLAVVPLLLSGIVIYGSLEMQKQQNYTLSFAAGVCAIVGGIFVGLLGWIFVLPVGIWAVVTLRKSESKLLFNTPNNSVNFEMTNNENNHSTSENFVWSIFVDSNNETKCPHCRRTVKLDHNELESKLFSCPICNQPVRFA